MKARSLIKRLKFYLNVARRDGFFSGVINASSLLDPRLEKEKKIMISEYPGPVYFRAGTSDTHLIKSILYQEEYRIDTRTLEPKLILDVGANAGYASLFFANTYPSAEIFSYEPEEGNFELLKKNTGGYKNVKTYNAAIWGVDTKLIARYKSADAWSFSLKEMDVAQDVSNTGIVNGISIATLLKKRNIATIDILKIDIEGGELSLFSGDCSWLHKIKIIVIELHDRKLKGCSQALYSALIRERITFTQKNMNYNTVIYNEAYFG